MGMSLDQALKKRDQLRAALRDVYSAARCYGSTSTELNAARMKVLNAPRFAKCPYWVRAYADGVNDMLWDFMYRYDLVYGSFVSGKFYTHDSRRPDYYGKHGISPRDVGDRGGHYWAAHVDKGDPRPFFTSEDSARLDAELKAEKTVAKETV